MYVSAEKSGEFVLYRIDVAIRHLERRGEDISQIHFCPRSKQRHVFVEKYEPQKYDLVGADKFRVELLKQLACDYLFSEYLYSLGWSNTVEFKIFGAPERNARAVVVR